MEESDGCGETRRARATLGAACFTLSAITEMRAILAKP